MSMIDNVTKALECCIPMTTRYGLANCENCPYDRKITLEGGVTECCHDLLTDALSLLQIYKPIPPKKVGGHTRVGYICGECGEFLSAMNNYCPNCGKKVDWE